MPPKHTNFIGIFLLTLKADFTGIVLGSVFANDKLKLKISLLHHYAFNRLPNVWFVIVGYHVDGNDRVSAKFLCIRCFDARDIHRVAIEYSTIRL